jgi:hypothetical protein
MVTVIRAGSLVDIPPGNAAMIAAYGGAGNIQNLDLRDSGNDQVLDKSAITN